MKSMKMHGFKAPFLKGRTNLKYRYSGDFLPILKEMEENDTVSDGVYIPIIGMWGFDDICGVLYQEMVVIYERVYTIIEDLVEKGVDVTNILELEEILELKEMWPEDLEGPFEEGIVKIFNEAYNDVIS